MRRYSLKSDTLRLIKICHDKIHAFASKCSHFLSSTSTASTSASEVKLVLGPLRLILGHFDTRIIVKSNLNHLKTLSETASDDLSDVPVLYNACVTMQHQNSNGQHTAANIGPNQLWNFRMHRNNVANSKIHSSNCATLTDEVFWEFFLNYFLDVSLYQNEFYGKMKSKLHFNWNK